MLTITDLTSPEMIASMKAQKIEAEKRERAFTVQIDALQLQRKRASDEYGMLAQLIDAAEKFGKPEPVCDLCGKPSPKGVTHAVCAHAEQYRADAS